MWPGLGLCAEDSKSSCSKKTKKNGGLFVCEKKKLSALAFNLICACFVSEILEFESQFLVLCSFSEGKFEDFRAGLISGRLS